MNSKYFTAVLATVFVAVISFISCDQTENPVEHSPSQTSYQDLYNSFQRALKNTKSIEDFQQKKAAICTEMKAWNWNVTPSTRAISELSFEEQKEYLQQTLSTEMFNWVNRLQEHFTSNAQNISVEQIANDSALTTDEKQMLVAVLAGGDYLKEIVQTAQTRSAADCYSQYQKDCERALSIYAVSGTVGSLTGGLIGLAGASAVCALQLSWAEDDYNDCLKR